MFQLQWRSFETSCPCHITPGQFHREWAAIPSFMDWPRSKKLERPTLEEARNLFKSQYSNYLKDPQDNEFRVLDLDTLKVYPVTEKDFLDSEEFYDAMQAHRFLSKASLNAFENVKALIRKNFRILGESDVPDSDKHQNYAAWNSKFLTLG